LALAIGSTAQHDDLQEDLIALRSRLGLPKNFEFHWARNPKIVRAAFLETISRLSWDGAVLLVDKRDLPPQFTKLREPVFYGAFLGYLLTRVSLNVVEVKRMLIDGEKKDEMLVCTMRMAMSAALRARGIGRTPLLRAEPARQWDGLQVADMLAGAVVEWETNDKDAPVELRDRLQVCRYRLFN
jgi:hypothetical protein